MDNPEKLNVLIAPLDWGLGHATRCISLIQYLLTLNCQVTVAASPATKILLKAEFPYLIFLDIKAYNIVYSRKKRWMPFKILLQIPKILTAVKLEHEWLKDFLQREHFNAVISDNRYGFYSEDVYSVFITHQLQIRTSLNLAKNFMRRSTYKHINNFDECWVPDFEGGLNIAGKLSHPKTLPKTPVKYLGPLSRFSKDSTRKIIYQYLIIISGPEPQRTLFEEKILSYVETISEKCIIVRGLPKEGTSVDERSNCKIFNHLSTKDLQDAFNSSEVIICRSGYTSVMEILSLGKKSVLIPTPGQTEQEYLAKHLMKQNWCYTFSQDENFATQLNNAKQFQYNLPEINTHEFETILKDFVLKL